MRVPNPGAAALVLRDGAFSESIPAALVNEAMAATSDHAVAEVLRRWMVEPPRKLDQDEVRAAAEQLAAVAHRSPGEIGEIGRLSPRSGGQLVSGNSSDWDLISSATALALALDRFLLLWSLGTSVMTVDRLADPGQS